MYIFQLNSRLFLLIIVNLGSRIRNKRIIIDINRKIMIGVIFLRCITFLNEIMITRIERKNKSQNNWLGFEKLKFNLH